jgi:hypothetical protein
MARYVMTALLFVVGLLDLLVAASPYNARFLRSLELERRTTDPVFPDTPASCPICAQVSLSSFFMIVQVALPLFGGGASPAHFYDFTSPVTLVLMCTISPRQQKYPDISSCAQAAPVLANFSSVSLSVVVAAQF